MLKKDIMNTNEKLYLIALNRLKNVGDVIAKNLLAHFKTAENVFKAKKQELLNVPNIGELIAQSIIESKPLALQYAEKELKKIEEYEISVCFYTEDIYPRKLRLYSDAPLMLYYKGNHMWNAERIVAVVGTRKPTAYGKDLTEKFIEGLKDAGVIILSGLAYGIDAIAHQAALDNQLITMAVLGNGLPDIYPSSHRHLSDKIITSGGCIISEFPIHAAPDANNFPKRNRIVAGLADAIIVIESKENGGSMITASIAASYNKDVFAFPGRVNDLYSSGCNGLIKLNKAQMIENAEDFLYFMNWSKSTHQKIKITDPALPLNLSKEQEVILNLLREKQKLHIDELKHHSGLNSSQITLILLEMEMNNWIRSLPGNIYEVSI